MIPPDPRLDVRHLRTFLAVAELGSINRAADAVLIAQPALSRQIKLLEDAVGVRLFERHGRGMAITAAGELLVERARLVLASLEELRSDLAGVAGRVVGEVALGLPPTIGAASGARLIGEYRERFPEVRLKVMEEMSGYLTEWLHDGRIDLAVIYENAPLRGLQVAPLRSDRLCLVGPPGASALQSPSAPLSSLAAMPLILPGQSNALRGLIERAAHDAGVTIQVVIETDAFRLQKELVRAGHGYTVLPAGAVEHEIAAGQLCLAEITDPSIERRLVVATPSDRPTSHATALLRDLICEICR